MEENSNAAQDYGADYGQHYEDQGVQGQDSQTANYIWIIGGAILLLVGTIGNVLSLAVLSRPKMRRCNASVYLIVVAVVDLAALYTGLLRHMLIAATGSDIRHHSEASCKLHSSVVYFLLDLSAWLLAALSVERFLSVRWPHRVRHLCTRMTSAVVIVTVSLVLAAFNSHFLYMVGDVLVTVGDFNVTVQCVPFSQDYYYFLASVWPWLDLSAYSVLPLLVHVVCNFFIVKSVVSSLQRARRCRGIGVAESERQTERNHARVSDGNLNLHSSERVEVGTRCILIASDVGSGMNAINTMSVNYDPRVTSVNNVDVITNTSIINNSDITSNNETDIPTDVSNEATTKDAKPGLGIDDANIIEPNITRNMRADVTLTVTKDCFDCVPTNVSVVESHPDSLTASITNVSANTGMQSTEHCVHLTEQNQTVNLTYPEDVNKPTTLKALISPSSNNRFVKLPYTTPLRAGYDQENPRTQDSISCVNPVEQKDSKSCPFSDRAQRARWSAQSDTIHHKIYEPTPSMASSKVRGSKSSLQARLSQGSRGQGSRSGQRTEEDRVSSMTVMLVTVSSVFCLTTLPISLFNIINWTLNNNDHTYANREVAWAVLNILMYSNNAINFILYSLSGSRFRTELMSMCRSCRAGYHSRAPALPRHPHRPSASYSVTSSTSVSSTHGTLGRRWSASTQVSASSLEMAHTGKACV